MAEIYIQAKRYNERLEIYRSFFLRDPSYSEIIRKVEEFEKKLKASKN